MNHSHTTIKKIQYNLYGKGKIPCILIAHYGHHRKNSSYIYCYAQEIIEEQEYYYNREAESACND